MKKFSKLEALILIDRIYQATSGKIIPSNQVKVERGDLFQDLKNGFQDFVQDFENC